MHTYIYLYVCIYIRSVEKSNKIVKLLSILFSITLYRLSTQPNPSQQLVRLEGSFCILLATLSLSLSLCIFLLFRFRAPKLGP